MGDKAKHKAMVLAIILGIFTHAAAAREVAGVRIPEITDTSEFGRKLVLNGAGLVERFFHDIYVGALYLETRQENAAAVIGLPGAKRISMHFLYEEIDAEDLLDAWEEGIRDNVRAEELPELQAYLRQARNYFRRVFKGDIVELDFIPDSGTHIRINGIHQGTIPGENFYTALLKVWVGDKPADAALKRSMLGHVETG